MNDNWTHYWGAYWMLQAETVNTIIIIRVVIALLKACHMMTMIIMMMTTMEMHYDNDDAFQ